MKKRREATPTPAPEPAPERPPVRARWTPARQRVFLVALMEAGNIAEAAQAAGMSRSSAHRLRQRLAGTPFDLAWDQALAHCARQLANPLDLAPPPRR